MAGADAAGNICRRPTGRVPTGRDGRVGRRRNGFPAVAHSPRRVGAQYHKRWRGSRCCSAWEAVGPLRSNHRETECVRRTSGAQGPRNGRPVGTPCTGGDTGMSKCLDGVRWRGLARHLSYCCLGLPRAAGRRTGGGQALGRCALVTFNGYPLSSSSRTPGNLPGALSRLARERTHLEDGFALRCCQRLSGPDLATRRVPRGE